MRVIAPLVLLAAITMMHTVHVHALPRQDLAVRQDENDLKNQSHIFHHLDRNQRTANRDREHRKEAEKAGLPVNRKVSKRAQRDELAMMRVMEKRFIRSPDYSQGDDARGGSNSASPASTMQQSAKMEN